jgi:hypothetical protein
MNVIEETIEATLDANGQLRLTHQPRLPPGPVRVTIRVAAAVGPLRGLADVIREIAAEQRARGFPGRSAEDVRAEDDARHVQDAERHRELDAARHAVSSGRPRVLYYLDTVIVIYAVEGSPPDQQRALNHLGSTKGRAPFVRSTLWASPAKVGRPLFFVVNRRERWAVKMV